MRVEIRVPAETAELFLNWLNLAHTSESISQPQEITEQLVSHARKLHQINPKKASVNILS